MRKPYTLSFKFHWRTQQTTSKANWPSYALRQQIVPQPKSLKSKDFKNQSLSTTHFHQWQNFFKKSIRKRKDSQQNLFQDLTQNLQEFFHLSCLLSLKSAWSFSFTHSRTTNQLSLQFELLTESRESISKISPRRSCFHHWALFEQTNQTKKNSADNPEWSTN